MKFIKHRTMYGTIPLEDFIAQYRVLKDWILGSKHNIMLGFVDSKTHDIEGTYMCANQIIVQYTNGRFEILPPRVNGSIIKEYLGVYYLKIKAWSLMPAVGSELNRIGGGHDNTIHNLKKDVYSV